jgi:F0F1-type ATP synthase assembly protein I
MKAENTKIQSQVKYKNISLTTLGWDLAVPIFGAALLGYYLDKTFFTNDALTVILIIAGIFIGYYNLVKLIQLELLRTKVLKKRQRRKE